MRKPFRFWMTGCFAVVMAALGGRPIGAFAGVRDATEFGDATELRASRYSAGETVQRLESFAARHGLTVFAKIEPQAARPGEAAGFAVLVFESSLGGTPVVMQSADGRPDLPLTVHVRGTSAGRSEVFIGSERIARESWDELPADVARDLTELPALVNDALS